MLNTCPQFSCIFFQGYALESWATIWTFSWILNVSPTYAYSKIALSIIQTVSVNVVYLLRAIRRQNVVVHRYLLTNPPTNHLTTHRLPTGLPPIIRATCVFDTKFDGFFRWPIHLSAYVEMNKKNCKNFNFCFYPSAVLIENLRIFLPILTYESTFHHTYPCLLFK